MRIKGLLGAAVFKGLLLASIATAAIAPAVAVTLPSDFNNTLSVVLKDNGSRVNFTTKPYDLIDFTESVTCNEYYVAFSGTDSGAGTTTGAPWKSLTYAVAHATSPAIIHLLDDYVGVQSWDPAPGSITFNGKLKILGKATRTRILTRREVENVSTFAWAASGGNGAYVSTSTRAGTVYRAHFDANLKDGRGFPKPLALAASIAACQSTPGTFYWNSGTSSLYVHMFDGRIPDPDNGWIYSEGRGTYELQQTATTSAGVILWENIEVMNNLATFDSGGALRYRPVTTGSANTARVGFKNCLFYGSSGNGLQVYDADVVVRENCHAAYNHVDGFNDHSFITTGTKGDFITVYEYDCSATNNGYDGYVGQAALGTSCNATTAHDSIHILRANGDYHNSNGAVVADVNGVVSVNLYCSALRPTGTANPKACFWHSGTGAGAHFGMWLYKCAANDNGDASTILLDASGTPNSEPNGQIYVNGWLGDPDDSEVVGPALKDWAGNPTTLLAQAA